MHSLTFLLCSVYFLFPLLSTCRFIYWATLIIIKPSAFLSLILSLLRIMFSYCHFPASLAPNPFPYLASWITNKSRMLTLPLPHNSSFRSFTQFYHYSLKFYPRRSFRSLWAGLKGYSSLSDWFLVFDVDAKSCLLRDISWNRLVLCSRTLPGRSW